MIFDVLYVVSEIMFYLQVRPSVTFMISEPCPCCHGTGRVEALDTSFSKIEREICRRLVSPVGLSQLYCLICSVQFQLIELSVA